MALAEAMKAAEAREMAAEEPVALAMAGAMRAVAVMVADEQVGTMAAVAVVVVVTVAAAKAAEARAMCGCTKRSCVCRWTSTGQR